MVGQETAEHQREDRDHREELGADKSVKESQRIESLTTKVSVNLCDPDSSYAHLYNPDSIRVHL